MSAILSADDLNDFISPGVACIKPVETLPKPAEENSNPYEVTTEDKVAASASDAPPAQISLTDCLACSGCVTSAEAVLVSLQSHAEVLSTLDAHPELRALPWKSSTCTFSPSIPNNAIPANGTAAAGVDAGLEPKLFVATVSPQARASLAATFGLSSRDAGNMISQLLSGPRGLRGGGPHGSGFAWVLDSNALREAALVAAADEVGVALMDGKSGGRERGEGVKRPVLSSACPGWICYAEKTHPHILPHLSRLRSPQALAGALIKSVLAARGVPPDRVWHLAVMPCFDKKLEASRAELTSWAWMDGVNGAGGDGAGVRDVDCVITARELLQVAAARGISFVDLPRSDPFSPQWGGVSRPSFPDDELERWLFPRASSGSETKSENAPTAGDGDVNATPAAVGTSGGFLWHVLRARQAAAPRGSRIVVERGRNADVVEYVLRGPRPSPPVGTEVDSVNGWPRRGGTADGEVLFRAARYYGFRNIQNLVRRLKPAKKSRLPGAAVRKGRGAAAAGGAGGADGCEYGYVEVMACPGGCTNGGGQVKVGEVDEVRGLGGLGGEAADGGEAKPEAKEKEERKKKPGPQEQREWLAKVDEAYWSGESSGSEAEAEAAVSDEDEAMADAAEQPPRPQAEVDTMEIDVPHPSATTNGFAVNGSAGGPAVQASRPGLVVDGISHARVHALLRAWSAAAGGVPVDKLLYTSFREVESDVGKEKKSDVERVAGLASSLGGGW
ncbi:iron hydrogenase [Lineolata rhizophorae]|uniref:Nuclear architecture-related protein 1 n=1 Tax=Lineolata rhizophorae TaxID=578093 RepID=A0A6A6PB13_9PEZI|nr:iron hydrogenase [Lineolata rhizophorae]